MTANKDICGFLFIPPETRMAIYEVVLVTPEPLRPPHEPGRAQDASAPAQNMFDTTLLRINRQIHEEAKQTFYQKNLFNYTIIKYGLMKLRPNPTHPLRANCLVNMIHMTKISMNFTFPEHSYRNGLAIADYLQQVLENCPSLRTLTLTFQRDSSGMSRFLMHVLEILRKAELKKLSAQVPARKIFDALLQLPVLERLTIIALCFPDSKIMKNSVQSAPHIQWLTEQEGRGDEFADLTLQARTMANTALESRWGDDGTLIWEALHSWTYRPREERALHRAREQTRGMEDSWKSLVCR